MSKLAALLEKAGLIERDPADKIDEIMARDQAAAKSAVEVPSAAEVLGDPAPEPEPIVAPVSGADNPLQIPENTALDAIFAAASVPAAPFPVERLVKLIEGLKQLDQATQIAAIRAMDAADETWTIEGVLEDAKQKIGALDAYKRHVSAHLQQIESTHAGRIGELDANRDGEVTRIKAQIAELEKTLETTIASRTAEVSQLQSEIESARSAATREHRRIDGHIAMLRQIATPFSTPTTPGKPSG